MHKHAALIMTIVIYSADTILAGPGCSKPMRHVDQTAYEQVNRKESFDPEAIQVAMQDDDALNCTTEKPIVNPAIDFLKASSPDRYAERDSKKQLNLDTIPLDMLGKILGYLCDMIGTHQMNNPADLPVIMENIESIASVNKSLRTTIHSEQITNLIIQYLSDRFARSPEEITTRIADHKKRYDCDDERIIYMPSWCSKYQPVPAIELHHIDEVQQKYSNLIRYANAQKEHGVRWIPRWEKNECWAAGKITPCQSKDDADIAFILAFAYHNLRRSINNTWFLMRYHKGEFFRDLYKTQDLQYGLCMIGDCSYGTYLYSYHILDRLKQGWQPVHVFDHQHLTSLQSEEKYTLFWSKKTKIIDCDCVNLLRCILRKLRLNRKATCHGRIPHHQNKTDHGNFVTGDMYLWIRKDAIDEVINILGLQVSNPTERN